MNAVLLSKKVTSSIVKLKTVLHQWPGRVKSTTLWSTGQENRIMLITTKYMIAYGQLQSSQKGHYNEICFVLVGQFLVDQIGQWLIMKSCPRHVSLSYCQENPRQSISAEILCPGWFWEISIWFFWEDYCWYLFSKDLSADWFIIKISNGESFFLLAASWNIYSDHFYGCLVTSWGSSFIPVEPSLAELLRLLLNLQVRPTL